MPAGPYAGFSEQPLWLSLLLVEHISSVVFGLSRPSSVLLLNDRDIMQRVTLHAPLRPFTFGPDVPITRRQAPCATLTSLRLDATCR